MAKEISYLQALAKAYTELADACTELEEIKKELRQLECAKKLFTESLYDQMLALEDKHNVYFDINLELMWVQSRKMAQEA